jgi:alanyl-tRNA synthetase
MTHRLYYDNSELQEFESVVEEVIASATGQDRQGIILRETAFYPTSGGQVHDTGWLFVDPNDRVQVVEVAERDDGGVVHYLGAAAARLVAGATVHCHIDAERRRDHMQQHSGQHVLSGAFVEM